MKQIMNGVLEHARAVARERQRLAETVVPKTLLEFCINHVAAEGYEPDETTVRVLRDYLAGYSILLSGPAGCGKTYLMQCLGVHLDYAPEIVEYKISKLAIFHETRDGQEICIDDLGAENITSEWGVKGEVLGMVLAHREKQRGRTHITTNLTAQEIAGRYGDRILSRIMGMCKIHKMEGTNKRRPRPINRKGTQL